MEKIVSTITDIVPQITYDIIGRFVPGTIVILSWAIVVWPTLESSLRDELLTDLKSPSGWLVFLFLLAAYVVAIVLDGIYKLMRALLRRWRKVRRSVTDRALTLLPQPQWKPLSLQLDSPKPKYKKKKSSEPLMYDAIRVKSPVVGARIVKLRAERHLARVLIIGWGIAAVLDLYFITQTCLAERVWLEIALIIGIFGAYWFQKSNRKAYRASVKNHWRILELDQTDWYKKSSKNRR